tara:strand:- start:5031 stop:7115 length:2085 start_codon:yes stop_codon:yes gene_type:complete
VWLKNPNFVTLIEISKMKKLFYLALLTLCSTQTFSQMPSPAMVGYWENWNHQILNNFIYFSEIDPRYNVIMVSFASRKKGRDYELNFVPEPGKYWHDATLFKNEMAQLQSEGKKVFLSIGGATYPVMLDSLPEKKIFVSSVGEILDKWNFDGLDIDLETSSLHFNNYKIDSFGDPRLTLMIEGIQEIMTNYYSKHGKKLLLTMAPETIYVQGGMSENLVKNKYGGAYLPIIEALKDSIDMLNVQLYNSGTMTGLDSVYYKQSTPDFILALTEAVIHGFKGANDLGTFSGLPASKIGVGLPSCSGWGYTEPEVLESTMKYLLGQGPKPGEYTLKQEEGYPDLRGMMTWSINLDKNCEDSGSFINLYDELFNDVPYLKISNPDSIIITQEDGGIILVEVEKDSFAADINPIHWTVSNLPDGVSVDSVLSLNDTTVKIILKGNSNPGAEQFHIYDVAVEASSEAFSHSKNPLSKNFGIELTSPGYFIPTRIEAENFHHMFGSEIRPIEDTDNEIKLGGGNSGAYSDYKIIVPETKTYTLDFSYATPMNNKADYSILVDSVEILRDTLERTARGNIGWDTFKTISHNIQLSKGKHTLRIYINTPWYGLNWFEIKEGAIGYKELNLSQINLYPNPVTDVLRFQKNINGTVHIVDVTGKTVYNSVVNSNNLDASHFSPGIYQIVIEEVNKTLSMGRFVKR